MTVSTLPEITPEPVAVLQGNAINSAVCEREESSSTSQASGNESIPEEVSSQASRNSNSNRKKTEMGMCARLLSLRLSGTYLILSTLFVLALAVGLGVYLTTWRNRDPIPSPIEYIRVQRVYVPKNALSTEYHMRLRFATAATASEDFHVRATISSPQLETARTFELGSPQFSRTNDPNIFKATYSVPWIGEPYEHIEFTVIEVGEVKVGRMEEKVRMSVRYTHQVSDFLPTLAVPHNHPISLLLMGYQASHKSTFTNQLLNFERASSTFLEYSMMGGIAVGTTFLRGWREAEHARFYPLIVHDPPGLNIYSTDDADFVGQQMHDPEVMREILRSAQECFEQDGCNITSLAEMHKDRPKTTEDSFDAVAILVTVETLEDTKAMEDLLVHCNNIVYDRRPNYFLLVTGDRVSEEEQSRIREDLTAFSGLQILFVETYDKAAHPNGERNFSVDLSTFGVLKAFEKVYQRKSVEQQS